MNISITKTLTTTAWVTKVSKKTPNWSPQRIMSSIWDSCRNMSHCACMLLIIMILNIHSVTSFPFLPTVFLSHCIVHHQSNRTLCLNNITDNVQDHRQINACNYPQIFKSESVTILAMKDDANFHQFRFKTFVSQQCHIKVDFASVLQVLDWANFR